MDPPPTTGFDVLLIQGCVREAERGDIVGLELDGLRIALAPNFHPHMTAVTNEIRFAGQALRELADLSQVHLDRVPIVLNYLNTVLPCLCLSLRQITEYYDDRSLSRELRWRTMSRKMADEAGGLSLRQRFMLYNQFLEALKQLLTGSVTFDLGWIENLRRQILHLREQRGIPPPPMPVGPQVRSEHLLPLNDRDQEPHWSQTLFVTPPLFPTVMRGGQKCSKSLAVTVPWGYAKIPSGSRVLFRRSFDNDKLSVTVYCCGRSRGFYILLRTYHGAEPWFSLIGVHELFVERVGSALKLVQQTRSENRIKLWAELHFPTWEEMVLFHFAFVSLKAQDKLTMSMRPGEYLISTERDLFQARIIDDGEEHSLVVFEDVLTRGLRLHTTVARGDQKGSPVWTAFVAHLIASPVWPQHQKTAHRVWLRNVQVHAFCQRYQEKNQRQNKSGDFEIYFISEGAPRRFRRLFKPSDPFATV